MQRLRRLSPPGASSRPHTSIQPPSDVSVYPACRLKTDPTNPLEAVESYQEGADLLSQARWVAQPAPVVARNSQLYSAPSSHAGWHDHSRLGYPTAAHARGRPWK